MANADTLLACYSSPCFFLISFYTTVGRLISSEISVTRNENSENVCLVWGFGALLAPQKSPKSLAQRRGLGFSVPLDCF